MLTYDPNISWKRFAEQTILTDDLDPVYVALYKSGLPEDMLLRWCAAFVTYYHMGTASQLCVLKGDNFWTELWKRYDTNPRASERRHFRGEAGKRAITEWRNAYGTPEKFFIDCMQPSFMKLLKKGIPQIGQYFSWKCMDLREAVFGYDVDWTGSEHHMVTLPKQGLDVLFPQIADSKPAKHAEALFWVVEAIQHLKAPPRYNRMCGVAEAETVCCMAKTYYRTNKPVGTDIVEKRRDLTGYGEIADRILASMPPEPFDEETLQLELDL